jgi:hypothetical protein
VLAPLLNVTPASFVYAAYEYFLFKGVERQGFSICIRLFKDGHSLSKSPRFAHPSSSCIGTQRRDSEVHVHSIDRHAGDYEYSRYMSAIDIFEEWEPLLEKWSMEVRYC